MNTSIYRLLNRCTLFTGLTLTELARLVDEHNCNVITHHKGSVVAFRGDRYNSLWILIDGRLRAEFQNHRGKVLKVESLKPGEIVASSVLFAPNNFLPVTLIAEEDTKICSIPKRKVIEILADPRVLTNYLEDTGFRLSFLAEKLNMLQFSTIREKIAHYLLDEVDRQGMNRLRLPLSKEALSDVFGVTRPALSREFSNLCDEGILSREGRIIHVLKPDELMNIVEAP